MITLRKAEERGHADYGWLHTHYTFSFNTYRDPRWMGFRALRVINEDRVQPSAGFPTHPHRDMEIVTYILEGALEHRDSMGTGSIIRRGEVQRMTAGTGVTHSEFNHSSTEPVHLLQIWLLPERRGLPPSYEQRPFPDEEKRGRLRLIASPDGREGSLTVNQDVALYAALLDLGQEVRHELSPGRHAWVQVALGSLRLKGELLRQGDGVAVSGEGAVRLEGEEPSELLLFDLA